MIMKEFILLSLYPIRECGERRNGQVFKEIMVENSPKLAKVENVQV